MQHDTKALEVSYGNFGLVWLAHCHRASDPGLGVQNQRAGPGSSGEETKHAFYFSSGVQQSSHKCI